MLRHIGNWFSKKWKTKIGKTGLIVTILSVIKYLWDAFIWALDAPRTVAPTHSMAETPANDSSPQLSIFHFCSLHHRDWAFDLGCPQVNECKRSAENRLKSPTNKSYLFKKTLTSEKPLGWIDNTDRKVDEYGCRGNGT